MTKAVVNKIIPFSSVDGPGNRTSIFLQGCNFNCLYCHNPETINHCNHCGICVEKCPYDALRIDDGKVMWDRGKCEDCDMCIVSCPRESTPKTNLMDVEDVLKEISKVRSFISGITVSGGECTLQSDFLVPLFKEVKKMNLTTFVDSNGTFPFYENEELVKVMDSAMIDFKSYDKDEHKRLTGMDNDVVIKNIKYLSDIDKLYEVRTVIVPEVLDNIKNVENVSKLIASLNPNIRYKIIKFRNHGVRKDLIESFSPEDEFMKELSAIAKDNGCKDVVIV